MGDYRKLRVWQLASSISDRVNHLFEQLPPRVQKGLGDQLVRAADSIHLNISEGCGLNSDAQLARCTRMALGEANELEDGLARLEARSLIPQEHATLPADATVLRKQLGAFLKRLTKRKNGD